MLIIMKLAFPLPLLIMLLIALYLMSFFYKPFKVGNNHFETSFCG